MRSLQVERGDMKPERYAGEEYRKLTHVEHLLERPEMYIGSTDSYPRDVWLMDRDFISVVKDSVTIPPAMEKVVMEILSNAYDSTCKAKEMDIDPGYIYIHMEDSRMTVSNIGGRGILVEIHKEEKVYNPELIFGNLLAGSSFGTGGGAHGSGRYGIGAKSTNVYSREFSVYVDDPITGKNYSQTWHDNMSRMSSPLIGASRGKSEVTISFVLDFPRFGVKCFTEDCYRLFYRHAIDVAYNSGVIVSWEDASWKGDLRFPDIRDYARLYFGDRVDTGLTYRWEGMVSSGARGKEEESRGNFQCLLMDAPDSGFKVSFANCVMTADGGTHVDAVLKAFCSEVVTMVNASVSGTKRNGDATVKAKETAQKITITDVKPHVSLILSFFCEHPEYGNAAKSSLISPKKIPVIFTGKQLASTKSWEMYDRLYAILDAKRYRLVAKTDGKKRRHVGLLKGIDANEAGGSRSHECGLFVCEGDSALGYCSTIISYMSTKRDLHGTLPLRGKGLNVLKLGHDISRYYDNAEIIEIKKALGLREGVDYTDEKEFRTLRYGYVMIMADPDLDGKHIIGLIYALFYRMWPSLLRRGFLRYFLVPILRLRTSDGKCVRVFYKEHELGEYLHGEDVPGSYSVQYFKGLGTSKREDVEDDYNKYMYVETVFDRDSPAAMELAFASNTKDQRKEWICNWKPCYLPYAARQSITEFVYDDLARYSVASLSRGIPSEMDGQVVTRRKVICGVLDHFKVAPGKRYGKSVKVAQLAAIVAAKTKYHHGEDSLPNVLVNMAQDFPGANNIPLLLPEGNFGTREGKKKKDAPGPPGSDASQARYIHTVPSPLLPYIIRREDDGLLDMISDEGEEVEPRCYFPVVPLAVINGCSGVSTGFSTFMPQHHPLDVIDWLQRAIKGQEVPRLTPWFRGFQGEIHMEVRVPRDGDPIGGARGDIRPVKRMVVTGRYTIAGRRGGNDDPVGGDCIIVTEIPIGRSTAKYRVWLEGQMEDGNLKDYKDQSTCNDIYFELIGFRPSVGGPTPRNGAHAREMQRPSGTTKGSGAWRDGTADTPRREPVELTPELLSLRSRYTLSSIVFLKVDDGLPIRFDTVDAYMAHFYRKRLEVYVLRRDLAIRQVERKIKDLMEKLACIMAIRGRKLIVEKRPKSEVQGDMTKLGLNPEYYDKIRIRDTGDEGLGKLKDKIRNKEEALIIAKDATPEWLWLRDLDDLLREYYKVYPDDV